MPPVVDWPEHRWINPHGRVARTFGWSGSIALASRRRAPRFLNEKRVAMQMHDLAAALPFPVVARTSDGPIEDRIGQLESILGSLNRTIREDGQAFGVLVFPSAQVHAGDPHGELGAYAEIQGVLDRLDIPFVDYYEKTRDVPWEDLFFDVQSHWRPRGHQTAADLLRTLLVTLQR